MYMVLQVFCARHCISYAKWYQIKQVKDGKKIVYPINAALVNDIQLSYHPPSREQLSFLVSDALWVHAQGSNVP